MPCTALSRLAVAALAASALAVAACGGDGGGDDGGAPDPPAASGSDEQQIRAVIAWTGERLSEDDADAACGRMTVAAQRQMARRGKALAAVDEGYAERGGGAGTCEQALGAVLESNIVEDYSPRILSIDIDGDRARVTADVSHDDDERQHATLAREDGEWKIIGWFERASDGDGAGARGRR